MTIPKWYEELESEYEVLLVCSDCNLEGTQWPHKRIQVQATSTPAAIGKVWDIIVTGEINCPKHNCSMVPYEAGPTEAGFQTLTAAHERLKAEGYSQSH